MNAFFKSQFSCYPLSWMFYCRTLNNKMNRLHKRCLRIIYNNNTSSFTDLLGIDNSVSVHHRNIQVLATELHEFVNGLSPIYIYTYVIFNFTLFQKLFIANLFIFLYLCQLRQLTLISLFVWLFYIVYFYTEQFVNLST